MMQGGPGRGVWASSTAFEADSAAAYVQKKSAWRQQQQQQCHCRGKHQTSVMIADKDITAAAWLQDRQYSSPATKAAVFLPMCVISSTWLLVV